MGGINQPSFVGPVKDHWRSLMFNEGGGVSQNGVPISARAGRPGRLERKWGLGTGSLPETDKYAKRHNLEQGGAWRTFSHILEKRMHEKCTQWYQDGDQIVVGFIGLGQAIIPRDTCRGAQITRSETSRG